jgi:glycosyltransferase involved in cell wall biosynthesis
MSSPANPSSIMKKIGIFRSNLLACSEIFIRDQACSLRQWRPVMIGCRRVPDGLALDGLEVHLLGQPQRGRYGRMLQSLRYWGNAPDPEHVRILEQIDVRLIHAHFGTDAVDIWPVVRAVGLPMLVTLHGYDINIHRDWWEAGHGGLRRRVYPRRLLAMARHPQVSFIAASEVIRRRAIEYGIPESKLTVGHIGVDTSHFVPGGPPITRRSRRVLFVGRLVENKGVSYLIRAFEKVLEQVRDAELIIVGDGPLRATLQQQAFDLRLPVTFLGAVPRDHVKQQLDECRVLCLPSVTIRNGASEGFGMVVLESQACGVPVVTSARGASEEGLEHGVSGFRFPERDINALAEALARILSDDALLSRMSLESRSFVTRKYGLVDCTRALEHTYDQFVEAPNRLFRTAVKS